MSFQNYSPNARVAGPTVAPDFTGSAPFADPFVDLASVMMPISVPSMLRHAEFFALGNETLREAFNRIAAYFLTDVEVLGPDTIGPDEKDRQKKHLLEQERVISFLHRVGLSFLVYGNAYVSAFLPFTRYLVCPTCQAQYRFQEFADPRRDHLYHYKWANGITGTCPSCRFSGVFADANRRPYDVPDESQPLILKCWNPHDIRHEYVASTDRTPVFYWIIPAADRTDIKNGFNVSALAETPWEHVEAVLTDKNVMMRVDKQEIFHWAEPALAGLRFRGVGVPRSIVNYRQLYYTQVLRRMNEVLALGHVVPIRVISPANTSGRAGEEVDILKTAYLGGIKAQVMKIVANHRADPNSYHFSPIPLQMQALGADARQLIPADIMKQAHEVLLNGSGVPVDFFNMSIQTQAAPVGLRLIERTWAPFVDGLNQVLSFVGRRAQYLLAWEAAEYRLERVLMVDAIELNQLRVQMAQAGLLSRSTAVKVVGENFADQTKQKLDDTLVEMRIQAEAQKTQDAFAFGQALANAQASPLGPQAGGQPGQPGQAPTGPGGAPQDPSQAGAAGGQPADPNQPQPGPDPVASLTPPADQPISPQDLLSRAKQLAQYLEIQVPEGQRYSLLQRVRQTNESFHGQVKAELEKLRSSMRSQGRQALLQQARGGQGGGQ